MKKDDMGKIPHLTMPVAMLLCLPPARRMLLFWEGGYKEKTGWEARWSTECCRWGILVCNTGVIGTTGLSARQGHACSFPFH